jgi:MFS family permease
LIISGAFLPPLVVWLTPLTGWRNIWLGTAGLIVFVAAPVAFLVLRDRPSAKDDADYLAPSNGQVAGHVADAVTVKDILTRPNFWVLVGVFFLLQFTLIGWSVNLAPFASSRGVPQSEIGVILAASSAAGLVAMLVMGIAVDRFGPKTSLLIPICACVGGFALLYFAQDFPLILAASMMLALGGGVAVPATAAMASEFGAEAVGRALGFSAISAAFGATAPPIVARLREATGDYGASILLLLGAEIVCVLVVLMFKERRQTISSLTAPQTQRVSKQA